MTTSQKRYLVARTECPISWCGSTFITKQGLLGHMKRKHGFSREELEWPRRFLREVWEGKGTTMTYTNYAMRRLTTYTARLEARHKRLVEAARAVLPAIRWGMTHQPGNLNQWTDCEAQIEAALKAEEEP